MNLIEFQNTRQRVEYDTIKDVFALDYKTSVRQPDAVHLYCGNTVWISEFPEGYYTLVGNQEYEHAELPMVEAWLHKHHIAEPTREEYRELIQWDFQQFQQSRKYLTVEEFTKDHKADADYLPKDTESVLVYGFVNSIVAFIAKSEYGKYSFIDEQMQEHESFKIDEIEKSLWDVFAFLQLDAHVEQELDRLYPPQPEEGKSELIQYPDWMNLAEFKATVRKITLAEASEKYGLKEGEGIHIGAEAVLVYHNGLYIDVMANGFLSLSLDRTSYDFNPEQLYIAEKMLWDYARDEVFTEPK